MRLPGSGEVTDALATSRAERKRAELRSKLAGLQDELAAWTAATGGPGAALPRHHSQVEAVVRSLRVTLGAVLPAADTDQTDDATLLRTWAQTEEDLLAVHEIWDYFRQKLALRYVPAFEPYLRMADDFAYACYLPAQQHGAGHGVAAEQLRAPPLVFLGRVATPYALARGASYAAEVNPAVLTAAEILDAVARLPIPVVGVPWFQLRHLPDALVIGHEVGHHVANDFRLEGTAAALVDAALLDRQAPADRRASWQGWLPEVFADVYGVLAAGPAYLCALADFVPTGPHAAAGSAGYPPAGTRVRLAAAASLATTPPGTPTDVEQGVLERWRADFADEETSAYHDDAPAVAAAVLGGPYPELGGAALTEVLTFADRRTRADVHARALLQHQALDPGIDVRVLLAATALAFAADPTGYEANQATSRVLAHAQRIEARGLRATTPTTRRPAADHTAGEALAALLATRHPR